MPKIQGSKSGEPVLNLKAFVAFLNDSQRDPRLNEILYPYFTEKSAGRLISLYEPSANLVKKVRKTMLIFDEESTSNLPLPSSRAS